uniref:helix-turn-helix domain-containing protein n=1 Tax=Agathobacter sp. TaxID=2021311 RepID=UPI004055B29D
MILADKIIRLRKKNGWSQEELAEKMNVSRQAVSKWEGAQTIPDLEKILKLGELFGVTTDYLLKDEMENEDYTDGVSDPGIRKITLVEANEYLELRKIAAKRIAIATLLCIIAVFPLLLLGVASEYPSFGWSEELACGVGLISMFPIIAIAVGIFIRVGFTNAPYEFIEKEPFETEYGVVGLVKDAQKKYRSTYVKYNYIGACICVLSPVPLLSAAFTENEFLTVVMLVVTMLIAGIGAMFFIVSGVCWASMQKLLKEGEYNPIEKKKSKIKETVGVVYWLLVTAIFFLWSFLGNDGSGISGNDWISWRQSWIVWPVAGVLFGGVMMICDLLINKEQEKK